MKFCRKLFVTLLLLLTCVFALGASDFYWENPAAITSNDSRFPKSVTNGKQSCVLWQEVDKKSHQIWISASYYDAIDNPVNANRFAGPVKYSGEIPDVYSAVMGADGIVYAAVLSGTHEVSVYSVSRTGVVQKNTLPKQNKVLTAPRLYSGVGGGLRLFASLSENESFGIVAAESKDGRNWSSFKPFTPSVTFTNPFVPTQVAYKGGDLVVFQAQLITGSRISYQLYGTYSTDGENWTEPVILTDDRTIPQSDSRVFTNYQNQQANLFNVNDEVYMTWERTFYLSENAGLWIEKITPEGIVKGSFEQLTSSGNASRAQLFLYENKLSAVWFDTRSGSETVYFAQKSGMYWDEDSLSSSKNRSMFAFPVLTNRGEKLSFVWEQIGKKENSVVLLKPDTTVKTPKISPLSFKEGHHSTRREVRIRVEIPDDSSGISGFSYSWSQNEEDEPDKELTHLINQNTLKLTADADGDWYFKARVFDYADNVSSYSTVVYNLDLTPPKKPQIIFDRTDKYGLPTSNSIFVKMAADESDTDLGGFTYNLDYLAPLPKKLVDNPHHPIAISVEQANEMVAALEEKYAAELDGHRKVPARVMTEKDNVQFGARGNGLYILTIAAIDEVGNISEHVSKLFVLNKFIPSTYIVSAKTAVNELGEVTLDVTGGGFTYDGNVNTIYIDRDGAEPYDLVLSRSSGHYQVTSDNRIVNIKLGNDLDEGMYRIGLVHTDRGLYMSKALVRIEQNGTIKIEPEITFTPDWKVYGEKYKYSINTNYLLFLAIIILSLGILIFAVHGFISTARESVIVRKEVIALITGGPMPQTAKVKSEALKKKGASLKIKLVGFTSILVMAIVALVSVPLGWIMTNMQERTLGRGLQQRVEVLLESL